MVFNVTFNNISVIWWSSVLLVEETRVPGENHRPDVSHWKTLSHNVVWVHLASAGFELTMLVVIGTDCIDTVNPTTIRSRPPQPAYILKLMVVTFDKVWLSLFILCVYYILYTIQSILWTHDITTCCVK